MKHYPHHIGDFDKATRHLTRIERSVYRDLLDMYYDTEAPIPNDLNMVCRKIIARSNEESTAVEQVLNEFFILTNDGWFNSRCDAEIEAYKANNSQKAMAGKASAAAKALRKQQMLNARSTDVEQPFNECSTDVQQTNNGTSTNHKPINHEPINQKPINTHTSESEKKSTRFFDDELRPNIESLNAKLGANLVTQEFIEANLFTFNAHYETQQLTENQRLAKWITWFKGEQAKQQTTPTKQPVSKHNGFASRDYSIGINADGSF